MADYRLYYLDPSGKFAWAEVVQHRTDADAVSSVNARDLPVRSELWMTVSSQKAVNSIELDVTFTDTDTNSPFSETVSWMNDLAGVYALRVVTNATPPADGPMDVDITAAFLTGTGILTPIELIADPGNTDLTELYTLSGLGLTAGTYTFTVQGTRGDSGLFGGHVDVSAVPEPSTWVLMLLGFGGLGWQLRRRRGLTLAQAV